MESVGTWGMDASVGDGVWVERLGNAEAKQAGRKRLASVMNNRVEFGFIV